MSKKRDVNVTDDSRTPLWMSALTAAENRTITWQLLPWKLDLTSTSMVWRRMRVILNKTVKNRDRR